MQVFLFDKPHQATNTIASSARTCYSSSGLVEPEKSQDWPRKESLIDDLMDSGHHTTLQHSYITLGIKGASRHFVWRFLHSHQYYNSEQVSQRYTSVKPEHFFYPSLESKDVIAGIYEKSYKTYSLLVDKLTPIMEGVLPKFKKDQAKKKAQEMARYVLPVGTSTDLYHTINIATALRYIAAAKNFTECRSEINNFIDQLKTILIGIDQTFKILIETAEKEKVSEPFEFYDNYYAINALQNSLHWDDRDVVKVYDITTTNIDLFGHRFNTSAFADILASNQIQSGPEHLDGFSSLIKLSLTADAQNQRHRRSVGYRPPISLKVVTDNENNSREYLEIDYYTPEVIKNNSECFEIYNHFMNEVYDDILKVTREYGWDDAIYLLPNAHNIFIVEKNDFAAFFHKSKMRLCWNAQQEIYDITLSQIIQLRALGLKFMDYFGAPCHVRSRLGIAPTCPEGSRFCGTKVWKEKPGQIIRKI